MQVQHLLHSVNVIYGLCVSFLAIYFTILLFSLSMMSRSASSLLSVAWTSWFMPTSFFRRASLLAAYNILVLTFESSGHLNNKKLNSFLHPVPEI